MVRVPYNERRARLRALRVAGLYIRNAEWAATRERLGWPADPAYELAHAVAWLLLALGDERPTLPMIKGFARGLR